LKNTVLKIIIHKNKRKHKLLLYSSGALFKQKLFVFCLFY